MKVYFVFSRVYALILLVVLLICSSLLAVTAQSTVNIYLETENQRNQYINSKGYADAELITVKEVFIPFEFDDALTEYNNLINNSGYDLTFFSGKSITIYTYTAKEKTIHLFTYKYKLICADICTTFNNISCF